jgi:hypothetical protein
LFFTINTPGYGRAQYARGSIDHQEFVACMTLSKAVGTRINAANPLSAVEERHPVQFFIRRLWREQIRTTVDARAEVGHSPITRIACCNRRPRINSVIPIAKVKLNSGGCPLVTESEVERSFRKLIKASDLNQETLDKAEMLLEQLRPESPLRHRLIRIDELREMSQA